MLLFLLLPSQILAYKFPTSVRIALAHGSLPFALLTVVNFYLTSKGNP
jgi:hypothetical protein